MATKNSCLNGKFQTLNNFDNNSSEYANLNLNQNSLSSLMLSGQTKIKTKNDKYISHSFVDDNYQKDKRGSDSWNQKKSSKYLSNFYDQDEKEDPKKRGRKDNSSNINSSTLSLHIAAYENSVEVSNNENDKDFEKHSKKRSFGKTWKDVKKLFIGPKNTQSLFEYRRQQEAQSTEPEVMQFRSSQRLLDPNSEFPNVDSMKLERDLDEMMRSCGLENDCVEPKETASQNSHASALNASTNSDFRNSSFANENRDNFQEIPINPRPYVPPVFGRPPAPSNFSFGGFDELRKKSPFDFFTRHGTLIVKGINDKPFQDFKGRCYSTSGVSVPGNERMAAREGDETFLQWGSSRKSKLSNSGTGESSRAPLDYVPSVRNISQILEDDLKSAKYYEKIYDFEEPLTVHGIHSVIAFNEWNKKAFPNVLLENIDNSMYPKPRQIQRVAMPIILDNYDVLVCNETGSGKTAAFLLPIIALCMRDKAEDSYFSRPCTPYAVIIAPTRELAHQNFEQALKFTQNTEVTVAKLYGEYAVNSNLRELQYGCDLLFATPGRLRHFFDEGLINLQYVQVLVFDEADTLLETGFMDVIDPIIQHRNFPRKGEYNILFFTATLGDLMVYSATRYMHAERSAAILSQKCATNKFCMQEFHRVPANDRLEVLQNFLKHEMIQADMDTRKFPRILIFVNSQKLCDDLTEHLQRFGFPAIKIRGNYAQDQRLYAFESFRNKTNPFLISTDVTSKGIDIKNVDLVLNYELPYSVHSYIYRVGRVGRIHEGNVKSFVDPSLNKYIIPEILKLLQVANHPVSAEFDEIVQEARNLADEANDPSAGFTVFFGDNGAQGGNNV